MPSCPSYGAEKVMKNDGKPKFSCDECRRQLVENPSNKMIPQEEWNIVGNLLLENISSEGISEVCIQNYINKKI